LTDPELALPAAGALAHLGDGDAFEALFGMLGHGDTAVRQAVIAALNSIGGAEMPARITALLDDPNPIVRDSAVRIAGYFGHRGASAGSSNCAPTRRRRSAAAIEHLPFFDDRRTLCGPGAPSIQRRWCARSPPRRSPASTRRRAATADPPLDDADPWVRASRCDRSGR
jgi:hypothetical protein